MFAPIKSAAWQNDLFETPVVPGLRRLEEFMTKDEERTLIASINETELSPFRFQQWTGKRLTHSFGWKYDFQSGDLSQSEPIPGWLLPFRDRAAAFCGLLPEEIVQALLIRYDAGAGIGWHRDRPIYEHVIGISLGAPASMRFRRKSGDRWQRVLSPLEPRGIYHLSGEVRTDWEHSIVEMDQTRYAITFRSFSEKGRRLAKAA
jgi:alkylated DNA repair protein (DNA oxidative demethylase)